MQGCHDLSLRSNSFQCGSRTRIGGGVNSDSTRSAAQRRRQCLASATRSPRSNSLQCGQGQTGVGATKAQRRRPCSVSEEDGQGQIVHPQVPYSTLIIIVLGIAFHCKPITFKTQSFTCHMVSHCVTCHMTQVNAFRLNPTKTSRYMSHMDERLTELILLIDINLSQ